jgi:hypothetical protein
LRRSFLVAAVALTACEPPTGPAGSTTPQVRANNAGGNGVVASATGGVQRFRGEDLWVLGYNATKRADGTVTGNYHVDRQDLGIVFDVDVTCMSVVGNTAWIAGIIRKVRGPLVQEGTVSYFYVIDNGEGGNAPPDIASSIRVNDAAGQDLAFCTDRPLLLASGPIDLGDLQVKGS